MQGSPKAGRSRDARGTRPIRPQEPIQFRSGANQDGGTSKPRRNAPRKERAETRRTETRRTQRHPGWPGRVTSSTKYAAFRSRHPRQSLWNMRFARDILNKRDHVRYHPWAFRSRHPRHMLRNMRFARTILNKRGCVRYTTGRFARDTLDKFC